MRTSSVKVFKSGMYFQQLEEWSEGWSTLASDKPHHIKFQRLHKVSLDPSAGDSFRSDNDHQELPYCLTQVSLVSKEEPRLWIREARFVYYVM